MEAFIPTRTPPPVLGTRILSMDAQNGLEVVDRLRHGLPAASVERVAKHLDLSTTQMLELADITSSTYFERKKRRQPLAPEASERVYRIAKAVEAAEAYFDDAARARRWLARAKVALGGRSPLEVAGTAEGAEYVVALLGRMAHGVIS
jgi:putative toxin-antitoxin system antitoxin component (TIGR02293 family)